MTSTLVRVVWLTIAMLASDSAIGRAQRNSALWLDEPKPAS
jgi:hypothetical protein